MYDAKCTGFADVNPFVEKATDYWRSWHAGLPVLYVFSLFDTILRCDDKWTDCSYTTYWL